MPCVKTKRTIRLEKIDTEKTTHSKRVRKLNVNRVKIFDKIFQMIIV